MELKIGRGGVLARYAADKEVHGKQIGSGVHRSVVLFTHSASLRVTRRNIQYITFLLMARAGLRALEFYDPTTKKHGQAHMQARYVNKRHMIASFNNVKLQNGHNPVPDSSWHCET